MTKRPTPLPAVQLTVTPGVGRLDAKWDAAAAGWSSWRIDRDRPTGARVAAWGATLSGDKRAQQFTLLDPLRYTITLIGTLTDGRTVKVTAVATPLPATSDPAAPDRPVAPGKLSTPWLPFDMVAELPADAPDVLGHVMPNYTLSDDDEAYALRIGAHVSSRSALPGGLGIKDAGRAHRTSDTDRLWAWTGTAWSDKGVCPHADYRKVGNLVPNPSDYWTSSVQPPGKGETLVHGGASRNRPPYQPRYGGTTREYRGAMAERNLRDMAARRINVATIHCPQIGESSTHFPRAMDYVRACERLLADGVDMHVMLMWDCTTSATQSVKNADGSVNVDASAKAVAAQFLRVANSPAHWRKDGKLVLGGFGTDLGPDRKRFWRIVRETMAAAGKPTYHLATFLRSAVPLLDAGWAALVDEGGEWGARTVSAATSTSTRSRGAAAAWHKRGKRHVAPVAWCDLRPRQGRGWPNGGLRTLDETWATAKGKHGAELADAAHLITWDDYPEGSEFAPSLQSGSALLDYEAWDHEAFLTGVEPVAERPGVFLCQRVQWWNDAAHPMSFTGGAPAGQTSPVTKQTLFIKAEGGTADNYADLRVFSPTGDGELVVRVDGAVVHRQSIPRSSQRKPVLLPQRTGRWEAELLVAGARVARVVARESVVQRAAFQDLQPRVWSSYRQALGE